MEFYFLDGVAVEGDLSKSENYPLAAGKWPRKTAARQIG